LQAVLYILAGLIKQPGRLAQGFLAWPRDLGLNLHRLLLLGLDLFLGVDQEAK
jgi:hypothetical protein